VKRVYCGTLDIVIEAVTADEAVEVLQSDHVIDLVVSDAQMPGSMDA